MKEVLIIVLVLIGALIGAGFASGQEIYSFFYSYGLMGLVGIIVTCSLISLTIYKSLKLIYKKEIKDYNEFLQIFIKNETITNVINKIMNILLLVTFYIMIAGFGAYFEQEIGVNKLIGSGVLSIFCAIVFFTNVEGVLKVSEYVVPILILFIVIIGGINIVTIDVNQMLPIAKKGWLISAITYCSYNIILLIPVLITVRDKIRKENSIKYISIITGILMTIMSVMTFMLLIKSDVEISTLEMPIVYVIRTFFTKFKPIYAFIILTSIFTTAISIGISFLQNIVKKQKSYPQFVAFMCISSLLISNFGFSKLVNFVYPLFGYIGIAQIIFILKQKN